MIRLHSSTHEIALGFALGVFLGWTPPTGLHMVGAFVLSTLVGANRIAAIAATWIMNPITFIPFYAFSWKVGQWVLRGMGVVHKVAHHQSITQTLKQFMHLPWKEQLTMVAKGYGELWVGGLVLGLATALISY